MPPKVKKTKAEEALAFLDDLDNLEAPPGDSPTPAVSAATAQEPAESTASGIHEDHVSSEAQPDAEAADALAFLEAQINQKRAPLSKPASSTPRTGSPALGAPVSQVPAPTAKAKAVPVSSTPDSVSQRSSQPSSSGWGVASGITSFWSSATSALQSVEQATTERVSSFRGQLPSAGVDMAKLRKDAEERFGGLVKNVDLDKLRGDLLAQASSTFTTLINTVAPPISAHETIELWLTHPMVGYDGVEGVIYRSWMTILEQTESGELVIVWSRPDRDLPSERTLNPVSGWDEGWQAAQEEINAVRIRESKNPRGRVEQSSADVPISTVPVFLQLQPVLAPLPVPEPPLLFSTPASSRTPSPHLYFIVTLQDPSHDLQFTTVSQPTPGDWLEVEYDKSDWVEERLVEVIRTSIEIIAQDYVATRMGLKPTAMRAAASQNDEANPDKSTNTAEASTMKT